jgi:hypothetical protein
MEAADSQLAAAAAEAAAAEQQHNQRRGQQLQRYCKQATARSAMIVAPKREALSC